MIFDQQEFDIRCEWGAHGIAALAPISDVIIIIDVLRFSTSVDVAVTQGAMVFPYRWRDDTALAYAGAVGAILADPERHPSRYSLSPASLTGIPHGTRLVLPSPNGATLTLAATPTPILAGCLRNAGAVAAVAQKYGRKIAVIPAGERWKDDGSLHPAFEDLIDAGAIIIWTTHYANAARAKNSSSGVLPPMCCWRRNSTSVHVRRSWSTMPIGARRSETKGSSIGAAQQHLAADCL
jgi:2-phosphosulfolactate phosphatase